MIDFDPNQERIDEVWPDGFWEAVEELAEIARAYCEQLGEALRQALAPCTESLRQALEALAAEAYTPDPLRKKPPRKKPPRPPRYAGPQNKGREWNRQPQRLARSHCRKNRR